ncbi:MAG: ABC transporter ATP-binding protein [Clostridia bacterium]|jgi:branched-chain amino acid transport system ATP-binding protein|nr:ABC transporter ATP-binding protein [Clostridia bacterium]MDD4571626.1 ABC transporter ATP-binding protein [Clostridia bacterium]
MSGHVISEEHILELENIDTRYGRIPCLMNISLHVRQGEVLAILGANGAGKTTLLKTILGMIKPDKGIIRFENNDITSLGSHKRVEAGMAIVAAGVGSFPKMTVETNLRMGAYYAKNQKEVQQRLELIYESFPILKERLWQKAGTLSGGERTMLSIARAVLAKPKIILMDEPSLGLAPIMVEETFEVIKHLKEEGMTIFLAEQNADKALEVSDYGYVIQKGQIVMEGNVEELRQSEYVENPVM